jgi:hypothetical protein
MHKKDHEMLDYKKETADYKREINYTVPKVVGDVLETYFKYI